MSPTPDARHSPDPLMPAEDRLITAMARAARGPQRNGLFALWLVVRVAGGLLPPRPLSARAHRGRLDQLERRLGSLSLPSGLKRACTDATRALRATPTQAAPAPLHQLAAAARDAIGGEAADALAAAARAARATTR